MFHLDAMKKRGANFHKSVVTTPEAYRVFYGTAFYAFLAVRAALQLWPVFSRASVDDGAHNYTRLRSCRIGIYNDFHGNSKILQLLRLYQTCFGQYMKTTGDIMLKNWNHIV